MPRSTIRGAQVNQKLGAREVHVRNVPHEQDDQSWRIGSPVHERGQGISHVIDVEIQERTFRADHEHIRLTRVLGMARQIREVGRPRDPCDFSDARTRGAADEQEN